MKFKKIISSESMLLLGCGILFFLLSMALGESLAPDWMKFHRKVIPMVLFSLFAGAAVYSLLDSLQDKYSTLPLISMMDVGASLLFCLIIYLVHSNVFVDDAGFILRYLDNLQHGCFFCYNVEDGPVFGTSGMVHGLFAAFFTITGLLSPEASLYLSNFLGIFLIGWLLLKIIRFLVEDSRFTFLIWAVTLSGSAAFLKVSVSGMETPLHIAIVLSAVYFFLHNKSGWFWALLALATISKLDVVPMVLVLGLGYIGLHWRSFLPIGPKNPEIQKLLFLAVVPVLLWILFTIWVFGSPLPQSAYSKMFHHAHPEDHWFPFLKYFTFKPAKLGVLITFLVLMGTDILTSVFLKRARSFQLLLPGMCSIAILGLFYFYNPGERMIWYYALPEFLMVFQIGLSIYHLSTLINHRLLALGIFSLGIGVFSFISKGQVFREFRYSNIRLQEVELERMQVGEYLANSATENDTLLAGHGLIARKFPGYVIDYTGLNSRLATDFRLDNDSILKTLHPHWYVTHGGSWPFWQARHYGYHLKKSFYELTIHGGGTWRAMRRNEAGQENWVPRHLSKKYISLKEGEFKQNKGLLRAIGREFSFSPPDTFSSPAKFIMGVYRKDIPIMLYYQCVSGDSVFRSDSILLPAAKKDFPPPRRSWEINIDLPQDSLWGPEWKLNLQPGPELTGRLEIIDPLTISVD